MPPRRIVHAPPGTFVSRAVLCLLFVIIHAWYWRLITVQPGIGFGDVGLYQTWAWDALKTGSWPVIDFAWVYPALAVIPVTLPGLASTSAWEPYATAWFALVTVANGAAVIALARRAWLGAIWFLTYLAFLGPVAFGRIDAIAIPIAVVGLLAAVRRPRVAAVLLTVGAWIKVAPGVLVLPLFAVARRRVRDVVVPAALVCVAVVGVVAAGGGVRNAASFAAAQEGRGLQIEAVAASGWVVQWVTSGAAQAVYNEDLVTWEIHGTGTAIAADLLGWLLPLTVAGLCWLTWRARSRLSDAELLVWSGLALSLALIVTNKVGSPQFLMWIAAPVAVGLAGWARTGADDDAQPDEEVPGPMAWLTWPLVAVWSLLLALLTQLVFPFGYFALIEGDATIGAILVARNVLLVGLFAVAVARLAVARPGTRSD